MEIPEQSRFDPSKLSSDELALLQRLQKLAAEGKEEIDPETTSLARRILKWTWADPGSLERAAYFMAYDPFLRREVDAINREFACAEGDGLEDY